MSETARRKMSVSEFYDWVATQTEGRYEPLTASLS